MACALFDALIIGAGPAGLSTATGLARQLHTAVVFNSGTFRNAKAKHMHNVVGWDHRNSADFRDAGRRDLLARYSTIQFEDVGINTVKKISTGNFEAIDANGEIWQGRKLVLATGVRDVYPDIDGYEECWADGIFHCLFCDGYEEKGAQSAGVLATDLLQDTQRAIHVARMARRLAQSVTIYTNGDKDRASALQSVVNNDAYTIDSRPFARLEKGPPGGLVKIHFQDGSSAEEGFMAHGPKYVLNGPFVQQLGLETIESGEIKVSQPFNEASVPGVFAAGDCAIFMKSVTPVIAMGTAVAAGVAFQIQADMEKTE
ncbi:thioredoxin reductase glit [Talaromyces proteolyticus]|uniref:Thioredoxin reductase glit n=1 Tax=Talaromyces proteolyticus TaxID=1131652 RepID=A0AAD4KYX6_9EURO|nr:thioredoxin reductase glit [Talaromyces proteolyticus]KAH8703163.1 thioredoxin reductase glit [Talaromyces proteolyticus]